MSEFRRSERELFPNPYATVASRGRRETEDADDFRTDFQRDVHRVIYSQSFRRLRHKTQVFYFPQNDHVSTRMDHVRFVASAARTVARCLRVNEDLAEAIGLAHDIGHAPFGHQGGDFLSAIIGKCKCPTLRQLIPSFSHEVYGLRVVDSIAKRDREPPGLNLTWEVRDGIVSHCGEDFETCCLEPAGREKDLDGIRTRADAGKPATLEGCIVRLIDKIAYAGKDMEDAIEVRLIRAEQVPIKVREHLGVTNGQIVRTLVRDMVRNSSGKDYIAISPDLGVLLHELIDFNDKHIYHSPQAEGYKSQAEKAIRYLFDDLLGELRGRERFASYRYPQSENKNDPVPLAYRILQQFVVEDMRNVYTVADPDELIVLDFVAGMTDSFAIRCISDIFIPKMMV